MTTTEPQPAVPNPKPRWFQMSKWTLLALSLLASYAAWQAFEIHRYRQGIEAACALTEKGAKVTRKSSAKDPVIAVEIDVRGSQVTDAELHYIIAVMSPKGRLRLDNSKITDEGVKRLQQALPNCKIER